MPYTTAPEVRARYSDLDAETYSDDLLTELIAEFEDTAERYRGIAYLPRTSTETVVIPPFLIWQTLVLDHRNVRSIAALTVNTVPITGYNIDLDRGIITNIYVTGSTHASAPSSILSVTYDHGLDAPTAGILRACKMYARNAARTDASGTTRDILSQNVDGATTRYSTPNWEDNRPTGWLDVDRLLNAESDHRIPGLA